MTDRLLFDSKFTLEANGNAQEIGTLEEADRPELWLIEWRLVDNDHLARNHYIAGPRPFDLTTYRQWIDLIQPKDES